MLRFILSIAILAMSCRACLPAEQIRAALSWPPADGWKTIAYSGQSLAGAIIRSREFPSVPAYDQHWVRLFFDRSPRIESPGYWKINEYGFHYYFLSIPGVGGWVESDLLGRWLVRYFSGGQFATEFKTNGQAWITVRSGSGPPVLPIFQWEIDSQGYLWIWEDEEKQRLYSRQRLIKREGKTLVVEENGKEIVLEYYLPVDKK